MNKKLTLPSFFILLYLIWFVTPVIRYGFGEVFSYLMLGSFIGGIALKILLDRNHQLYYSPVIYPAIIFCVCLFCFAQINWGSAGESLRVIITYWFPLIAFLQLENDEEYSAKTITKVLLFSIIITTITTYANLLTDSSVARALTSSDTEAEIGLALKMKNCGNIYLIQGMVLFVPFLINNVKKKIKPLLNIAIIIFIGIVLINASFTTSLLVYIIVILITLIFDSNMGGIAKGIWIILCLMVLLISFESLLSALGEWIPNDYIKERINKLLEFESGTGGEWSRYEYYGMSWETFKENWVGVGPYYFKEGYGVGNHSQILDDMARYGIFAVIFYVSFFIAYYKFLKQKWAIIGSEKVVFPYMVAMIIFLFLNPGLRGNFESVITLFIMPGLPLVIADSKAYQRIKTLSEAGSGMSENTENGSI